MKGRVVMTLFLFFYTSILLMNLIQVTQTSTILGSYYLAVSR